MQKLFAHHLSFCHFENFQGNNEKVKLLLRDVTIV